MKKELIRILLLGLVTLSCIFPAGCSYKESVSGEDPVISGSETLVISDSEDSEFSSDPESYLHISYKGKEYSYNSRIITVMYAGVDSDSDLTTYNRYTIAPRADTIELIIFDDYNKKLSILALSRDVITSVARYTMNGNYRDNYDTHLGYAYTYGDGGKVSCENLIDSVSGLLNGIPIREYVITNNSTIGQLNDLVGGVTVTIPNDDLIGLYPEFKTGATVTLDSETAETFTRWRDTGIQFTNNGRMERQKEFSSQFFRKFVTMVEADPEGTWDTIESFSATFQTSIARNQYLDLADRLETETFSEDQYYIPDGENVYDEENDKDLFYIDEEKLMDIIVKLFYLEDN